MTDRALVEKKLAAVVAAVSDLRRLSRPDAIRHDVREERFTLLARNQWIASDLARRLSAMAGFRNVLVHGYDNVGLAVVEDVVRHRLDDLLEFVTVITPRL